MEIEVPPTDNLTARLRNGSPGCDAMPWLGMRWDRVPAALSVSIVTVAATGGSLPEKNKQTDTFSPGEGGPAIMQNICP